MNQLPAAPRTRLVWCVFVAAILPFVLFSIFLPATVNFKLGWMAEWSGDALCLAIGAAVLLYLPIPRMLRYVAICCYVPYLGYFLVLYSDLLYWMVTGDWR